MTDTSTSGAPEGPAAEPAEAPHTPNAEGAPAATPAQEFGTFGSARGSGLARGKRSSAAAPTGAPAAGYKPTALEVITPAREYRNPFTGEVSVNAPTEAPAEAHPAPAASPEAAHEPAAEPASAQPEPDSHDQPAVAESAPVEAGSPESAKPGLTILPPAEARPAPLSWESQPARRGEPEGSPAGDREHGHRGGRDERRGRRDGQGGYRREFRPEQRSDAGRTADRPPRTEESRRPEPVEAPKGLFGWIRSLFGGKPTQAVPERREGPEEGGERSQDDRRQHRRHRGGRGRRHGGHNGGSSESSSFRGAGSPERNASGERRFDGNDSRGQFHDGGRRRRRHRGGRGRHHGEPRSEGTQGGGAI